MTSILARIPKKITPGLCLFWVFFLIGIFARVYEFGAVPGDINQDEAFAGYNAYTLWESGKDSFGYRFPVYLTAWGSGMNALESYLAMPFVAIFGLSVRAIRMPMLITAILSLLVLYKLFRKTTNERIALSILFLFAISPWHIILSRWGLESNLAPAFILFGLYFFILGAENPRYFIPSALFYGLSLYSYATIWLIIPFILLLQILYFIHYRKISLSKYTITAGLILILLAMPFILFLLVNKGLIKEIRLPFISIPKLLAFRGDEVSFENIKENALRLWNLVIIQDDAERIWNYAPFYGLYYKLSAPFCLAGFICCIHQFTGHLQRKETGIEFYLFLLLLAGIALGLLIPACTNRVNLIFIPLISFSAIGLYVIFNAISSKVLWIPVLVYGAFFVNFERYYFTEYRTMINDNFCTGIKDAVAFAKARATPSQIINVTPNASYPRILFFSKENLEEYLTTVRYTNYPSPFLDVSEFGRFRFYFENFRVDPDAIYIFGKNEFPILSDNLKIGKAQHRTFGNYTVYYP